MGVGWLIRLLVIWIVVGGLIAIAFILDRINAEHGFRSIFWNRKKRK